MKNIRKKNKIRYITKLNHKRFIKTQKRNSRKKGFSKNKKKKNKSRKKKDVSIKIPNYTSTVNFLSSKRNIFSTEKSNIPLNGVLSLPENFSLIDYPNESFKFLKDLFHTLKYPKNNKLFIDYSRCKRIDLDASVCMDVILKDFIESFKKGKIHKKFDEIRSVNLNDEKLKKFIYSIGAQKTIKGTKINYPEIMTYDLHEGNKEMGSGHKEVEATELVEHIEKCLNKFNKELTQESKENFANIIGEVISNAEEHSSTQYRYSIGHFEECHNNKEHIGFFQFVIFNFGESFYERLKDDRVCFNKTIINEMTSLSEKYTQRGWFGLKDSEFKEETLWSLYALQDGVSCIDPERGNGTINFIESFLELRGSDKDDKSKLALLTGNTRIIFDGTYKTINKINESGESHKVITFNDSNTLEEKPNKKFVKFVNNYFPGTMLYANICIKEENIN